MSCDQLIKKIRMATRYEQTEFADLIGVSKLALACYEQGRRRPPTSVIKRLVRVAKLRDLRIKEDDFDNTNNTPTESDTETLTNQNRYGTKTYRLSLKAIAQLDELARRVEIQSRIKLSKSKILELVIFSAAEKPLDELINLDK